MDRNEWHELKGEINNIVQPDEQKTEMNGILALILMSPLWAFLFVMEIIAHGWAELVRRD